MGRYEVVIATTHVDLHGERMDRKGLEALAKHFSLAYIPVGVEHDPRIPPQGRVASGFVRQRTDGEYEVVGILEIFEERDDAEFFQEDKRELKIKDHDSEQLTISYDRTYRFDEDQKEINGIAEVFGSKAIYELKKSVDPISVLTIAGKFVLGAIAVGFFGQIGADGWIQVKKKLVDLFSRTQNRHDEQLLVFRAVTRVNEHDLELEIILTNPTPNDIDQALISGLLIADKLAAEVILDIPDARRIIFQAQGENIELRFIVLRNCRVVEPRTRIKC